MPGQNPVAGAGEAQVLEGNLLQLSCRIACCPVPSKYLLFYPYICAADISLDWRNLLQCQDVVEY